MVIELIFDDLSRLRRAIHNSRRYFTLEHTCKRMLAINNVAIFHSQIILHMNITNFNRESASDGIPGQEVLFWKNSIYTNNVAEALLN